jgi:hypothetical protein
MKTKTGKGERNKATVWANAVPNGTLHVVSFARLFRDGDAWRSSPSFSRDDLLVLAKVADAAFDWIVANQQNHQRSEAADTIPQE